MARAQDRSPQSVDPLSWFTGPVAPLVFAALVVLYGAILTVTTWRHSSTIVLQVVAILVCGSACVLIHFATRPKRPPIGWRVSALALLITLCGLEISALDYSGGALPVEQWWAPGAVALAIASLAPYLAIRRLIWLGFAAATVVGVLGAAGFLVGSGFGAWSLFGLVVLLVTPPLTALAASSVFIVTVVGTMQRLLGERETHASGESYVAPGNTFDDSASALERDTLARLTARAAPFLERLAESGQVTATDRAVAGQLARRMRDDLVVQATASWLDAVAAERRLVVVDPDGRADTMNDAQKSALTALIDAILDTPDTGSNSVLVELRGQENGATAVGLSMDLQLPEGRRTMHLAPYYLTLKTAFEGLSWNDGRLLKMRFEVPPEQ